MNVHRRSLVLAYQPPFPRLKVAKRLRMLEY